MSWRVANTALAAVAAVILTGFVPIAAQASTLINEVPCGRNDFLRIKYHKSDGPHREVCFANAGEWRLRENGKFWVTEIHTGNNRVQWSGDGRYQPANPINKWTSYGFPNHPGGVDFGGVKIH